MRHERKRRERDPRGGLLLDRSEIFHASEEQRVVAEQTIRDVDASGHWPGKVVTRVSKAGRFWEEAPKQQDYLQRFPVGCRAPFPRQGAPATAS